MQRVYGKIRLKAIARIVLTLLLIVVSTSVFSFHSVKATPGTIIIKADGSIEPPDQGISTDDYVTYYFEHDISGFEIIVQRSNVTIDGNGFTLQGSGSGQGFYLYSDLVVSAHNACMHMLWRNILTWH